MHAIPHRFFAALALPALLIAACPAKPPADPEAAPKGDGDPDIREVKGTGAPARELVVDTGDLDAVLKRGTLRILSYGSEESVLPRAGASSQLDRTLAEELARSLGVEPQVIAVPSYGDLIPMLNEGKG